MSELPTINTSPNRTYEDSAIIHDALNLFFRIDQFTGYYWNGETKRIDYDQDRLRSVVESEKAVLLGIVNLLDRITSGEQFQRMYKELQETSVLIEEGDIQYYSEEKRKREE